MIQFSTEVVFGTTKNFHSMSVKHKTVFHFYHQIYEELINYD